VYDKTLPFEASIKWIKKETRDTATYALRIVDREIAKAYCFEPGQFNMLWIPGIGEAAISISSSPDDHDLMHTVRVAGDVTTALAKLSAGDVIGMRGPFGNGWPLEEAEDRNLVIIAGGVGIAPLRSVIRRISAAKKECRGMNIVFYGAKSPKDIIFRDEFPRYRAAFQVFLTVDKADPEEYWRGEVGLIPALFDRVSLEPLNTTVFICGPEIMMKVTVKELIMRGVPGEKIFLSLERNMNCGMGICGHCMFGPKFICKDGAIFRYTDVAGFMDIPEV
jgi:NAD(P)H-flavin reductase